MEFTLSQHGGTCPGVVVVLSTQSVWVCMQGWDSLWRLRGALAVNIIPLTHRMPHPIQLHPTPLWLYTSSTFSLHMPSLLHTITQSQNRLQVTHIIIPKQKGSPDSCETLSEEEIFDVQDQYDLITLGWIHVGDTSHIHTTPSHPHSHSHTLPHNHLSMYFCMPPYLLSALCLNYWLVLNAAYAVWWESEW